MKRDPKKPDSKRASHAEKKRAPGRPTKFTDAIARKIIDGLSKGIPLTVLCQPNSMPGIRTVYDWMEKHEGFSADIARARDTGWDAIALEALEIADNVGSEHKDTIETKFGEIPNKEWILRSKLRVETRLKLLAKWDPKRYGEKVSTEISGPDGKPIKSETSHTISEELEAKMIAATAEAARHAANVEPPASFRGQVAE